MKSRNTYLSLSLCCALGAACDDPPSEGGPTGLGMDAGADAGSTTPPSAQDAATDDGGSLAINGMDSSVAQPRVGPAYVVVSSDYSATALSVLDARGNVLADSILTSGSTTAGLVTTLSGDVELPRHANDPGVMVILDRFRTDVITRLQLSDGKILGQVKTQTPVTQQTSSTFSSNPSDYIRIDQTTAWITRAEPNLDPMAATVDLGNDLFRIDPSTMMRTTDRIDLSPLNATTSVTDPGTGMAKDEPVYARPSHMARVGDTLVVGIARTAFDFSAVGDGVVAVVDLTTKTVTPFAMTGYKSCTDVDNVPGDADTLLVTCGGDFNAADTRTGAGLALLGVHGTTVTVEHAWHAENDSLPNALVAGATSLGGTLIAAAANDYSGTSADVLATLDLATGIKSTITSEMPGTGRFGIGTYDADARVLLVPDSSVDSNMRPTAGIRRFQRNADDSFTELSVTQVAKSSAMPVHSIWPL